MKRKDLISIIASLAVIGVAIYFGLGMMGVIKKAPKKVVATNPAAEKNFTGNIDKDTLENINKLNDYGEASLDNIGRINPFAPIN